MARALNLLLTGFLLQGALCGQFEVSMPETINVLSGSCVTIPCSFDIRDDHKNNLDDTCTAIWRNNGQNIFDSSLPQQNGQLTGNLKLKDCSTTLNNIYPRKNNEYIFRLQCDNPLKLDYINKKLIIHVTDDPPTPTLTPSTLKVKEGTSVILRCSAPAPCLSHPPNLTWTPGLGDSVETLQENQDKTKVQTSVLTFTASHLHHGKEISCTAAYRKQDGSTRTSVSSITADISCALCGEFKVSMPETINVLSGSCVTIPCSFGIEDKWKTSLDSTCRAIWINDGKNIFDSSRPQQDGQFTGNLILKDCSTTLNNIYPRNNNEYTFRLDCTNALKYNYGKLAIRVTDDPPSPTLTPSTLKVKEGTSVSLRCSAPAPCLSHPPTLTWTPGLGDSVETLQETQDKTKVQTSVLNFTASHLHHGKEISCTAAYRKQDGSTRTSVSRSITADISYSPKDITVSVSPSGPVRENSDVTLTCSSDANPAVRTFTWYRTDGGRETTVGSGPTLTIKATQNNNHFFCKPENNLGAGRSNICQIDVQYSPKNITVSVSPSGPVPEDSDVTLTCISDANPAVRSYTWYSADGSQETFMGTGPSLKIKAPKTSFFCKCENDLGAGRSNIRQIDVQFPPKILPSSDCAKATGHINCSCETVGNPSPTLHWYVDGLPVNHSDNFTISSQSVNGTSLRSIMIVDQPHRKDLIIVVCRSTNSLGSVNQTFCVLGAEHQTTQDPVMLLVSITTIVAVLLLVCALLWVIRAQKTRRNPPNSQCEGDTSTVAMNQLPTNGERDEIPNTAEEDIYANNSVMRQANTTISETNNTNSPRSEPENAEGEGKSSKEKEEGSDVIYSSVNWKSKKKKKGKDSGDMDQPGSSYLEEERCMVGATCSNFLSDAVQMESLYDEPKLVKKEVECEYAQVQFKDKRTIRK